MKNAYDADATKVTINLDPQRDQIIVQDNGHGMTIEEFKQFWMRVGSPHKRDQKLSRHLQRPMTGAKGVGRLAVQLLAKEMELYTSSVGHAKKGLRASVNWNTAISVGDLTEAKVLVKQGQFKGFSKGMTVILRGLNQPWNASRSAI